MLFVVLWHTFIILHYVTDVKTIANRGKFVMRKGKSSSALVLTQLNGNSDNFKTVTEVWMQRLLSICVSPFSVFCNL